MKNYLNVTVFIAPGEGETFQVRAVSDERGGEGNSVLRLPFALTDIEGAVFSPGGGTRDIGSVAAKDAGSAGLSRPSAHGNATDVGVALFEALFQGEARDVLRATESAAEAGRGAGVRIRLSMDLQSPRMAAVASLPWELMRRRGQQPFVVSAQTPLVRALDTPRAIRDHTLEGDLRILVIMSNPKGSAALDLEAERRAIEASWAKLPGVQVDFVKPVQADVLKQLASADYHVIHYMGHGDFAADSGGMLLLEEPDGRPHLVSGTVFATWLTDEPLRLVFLNACKSGTTAPAGAAHPFAGVASALIRGGVPAVVAMQFPITDDAATEFARTFYERIAQNFPVDGAVAEGRKALYSDEERAEWATPVLYLRGKDGRLFTPAPQKHAAPAPAAAPPTPAPAPMAAFSAPVATVMPWYKKPVALVIMGMVAMLALIIILVPDEETPVTEPVAAAADAAPAEEEAATTPAPEGEANPALEAIEAIDPGWWINEPEEAAIAKAVFKTTSFDAVADLADGGGGDRRASFIVGEAQYYGLNSAGKAPDIAMQWYNAAAYKQLPVAELALGYAYAEGVAKQSEGGEALIKDSAAAKVWFGRASRQGNVVAQDIVAKYDEYFPETP